MEKPKLKICLSTAVAERFGAEIQRIAPHADLVRLGPDGRYDGDAGDIQILFFSLDLALDEPALAPQES